MGNWYGKGKRGLVMGVWNAHTSLGNILGTVIAAACLQYGWGYAFIVPGALIGLLGVVVYAVLVVQPSDVGLCSNVYEPVKSADTGSSGGDTIRLLADGTARNVSVRSSRDANARAAGQNSWQGSSPDLSELQVSAYY